MSFYFWHDLCCNYDQKQRSPHLISMQMTRFQNASDIQLEQNEKQKSECVTSCFKRTSATVSQSHTHSLGFAFTKCTFLFHQWTNVGTKTAVPSTIIPLLKFFFLSKWMMSNTDVKINESCKNNDENNHYESRVKINELCKNHM